MDLEIDVIVGVEDRKEYHIYDDDDDQHRRHDQRSTTGRATTTTATTTTKQQLQRHTHEVDTVPQSSVWRISVGVDA
jgi:hypothetical protein